MDVIYTDKNRIEQGSLQNFDIDFDCTNTKDFLITVGIDNNVLQGSSLWYIEGTEYGGKVDSVKIVTEKSEIQYSGRNARGLLTSKIIEPPAGSDYLVLSGNLQHVISKLINDTDYSNLFVVDNSVITVSNYKFDRYINLYDGIVKLLSNYNKIPKFTFKKGKIHIGIYEYIDYSDENEFSQDNLQFTITKSYSDVNHLICLGKGELKDRMVIHLYADGDGNISEKKTFVGEQEVVEVYENTSAENRDELLKEGTQKLKELKNSDSFEVTVPDIDLKIGDIIGGTETTTNTYVAREIVNIIAKISDDKIELDYMVGEDSTAGSSSGVSSVSSGGSLNIKPATRTELGGVIVGDNLSVREDGTLSANKQTDNNYTNEEKRKLSGVADNANNYILPAATKNRLGGIIVGDGLSIEENGRLSADKQTDNNYTDKEKQKLYGIEDHANNYELPPASALHLGGVMTGIGLSVTKSGIMSVSGIAGGGIARVTLWEGELRTEGSTGECSQSIENFDYLLMYYKPDYEYGYISVNERKLLLEDVGYLTNYSDNSFSCIYYGTRYMRCTFLNSRTFKVWFSGYGDGCTISLVKIVGIKLIATITS